MFNLSLIRAKACFSEFDRKNADAYKRRITESEMRSVAAKEQAEITGIQKTGGNYLLLIMMRT